MNNQILEKIGKFVVDGFSVEYVGQYFSIQELIHGVNNRTFESLYLNKKKKIEDLILLDKSTELLDKELEVIELSKQIRKENEKIEQIEKLENEIKNTKSLIENQDLYKKLNRLESELVNLKSQ